MTIGVLGTGTVGRTLATKLLALGHDVWLGSRSADHPGAAEWAQEQGSQAHHGTFRSAVEAADLVINATNGGHSVAVIGALADALAGKVLLDVSNPLTGGRDGLPALSVVNHDSLAEQLQRAAPEARVVKTLNTMNAALMVDPASLAGGDHDVFVSGDDAAAKAEVIDLLRHIGWQAPIDLGALSMARGTEMWLPLWLRLYSVVGHARFQLKVVR